MRGFAQTLFNALLGWIRTLVEGVWDILFSSDAQQWLRWIGDNWMVLFVFLCLCGVALDYVVWFFRWRPYYVWGSSMRRLRRIFGGGKREHKEEVHQTRTAPLQAPYPRERRRVEPVYRDLEAPLYDTTGYEDDTAWNSDAYVAPLPYEQEPDYGQEPTYGQESSYEPEVLSTQPQATTMLQRYSTATDTILARPRKADYQEQYVRRFARPEPEPVPDNVYDPVPVDDWTNTSAANEPVYDATSQDEYWAPQREEDAANQPIHPGIDYQAMSREYGWHVEKADNSQSSGKQPSQTMTGHADDQSWDFSGMDNFAPYHSPEIPKANVQRPERTERTKKQKSETSSLNKVRNSLSRIAQRAGKVLTVDDEQAGKLIDGLPPPIDKRRAFHAPVYPNRPGSDKQKSPDFQEDD